jgi:hypothetical protein
MLWVVVGDEQDGSDGWMWNETNSDDDDGAINDRKRLFDDSNRPTRNPNHIRNCLQYL